MEKKVDEIKREVREGRGLVNMGKEEMEGHMRGVEERREERQKEWRAWEEKRAAYEGVGEEVVGTGKWGMGERVRRGPRVRGTNV